MIDTKQSLLSKQMTYTVVLKADHIKEPSLIRIDLSNEKHWICLDTICRYGWCYLRI